MRSRRGRAAYATWLAGAAAALVLAGAQAASGEPLTPIDSRRFWNDTDLEVVAGQPVRIDAVGVWYDAGESSGAGGYPSHGLLHLFTWMRRQPRAPWFALIACVDRRRCQWAEPGKPWTPRASGRLSFYANDVGFMYFNNRDCLHVRVAPVRPSGEPLGAGAAKPACQSAPKP